ncbi:MAG: LamG domain-containing protein [Verrucomicrobia bacterium]|nr:LamG domain-containing protein [Verrucomicrobiota bacterium]
MIKTTAVLLLAILALFGQHKAVAQSCLPAPSGLVNWWPADGHTNDVVTGVKGTLHNGATFASGKVGQAFSFDGINDYATFGTTAGNFGTNDFTVELWMKISQTKAGGVYILSKRQTCGNGSYWNITMDGNGVVGLEVENDLSGSTIRVMNSTNSISDGDFHHVVFRRASTNLSLWVDGVMHALTNAPVIYNFSNSGNLMAANGPCVGSNGSSLFAGQLDEISFYNRALTLAEMQALYAAGSSGKCKSLAITSPSVLPGGTSGAAYSYSLSSDGSAPFAYSLISGALPEGLSLASSGTISGVPTAGFF